MILRIKNASCTFPAQRCKSLMLNGAGEGNRTLVTMQALEIDTTCSHADSCEIYMGING